MVPEETYWRIAAIEYISELIEKCTSLKETEAKGQPEEDSEVV